MSRKGILLVISGFSGAGKGTLVEELVRRNGRYALSVSMTTRPPRAGEQEGVSYFFVDRERFEREIAEGGLIEYTEYCGNYYGTPRSYVERQLDLGKDVILEIEMQGARRIRDAYPEAVLVFVAPPTLGELQRRLAARGTEDSAVVLARLTQAVREADAAKEYDYIVVNDDLETCAGQIQEIADAARLRAQNGLALIGRMKEELEAFLKTTANANLVVGGEKP